jgi:hypothetical protein
VTVQNSLFAHARKLKQVAYIGTLLTAASSCGEQVSARAEADALMTSLHAVSDESSFVDRSAALERLNQLALHFAPHIQTREVCSAAHKGLLEAEIAQTEARRALAGVSASVSEAGPQANPPKLERAQAESIAADIERSTRALATAKERFPECEKAMRGLLREAR